MIVFERRLLVKSKSISVDESSDVVVVGERERVKAENGGAKPAFIWLSSQGSQSVLFFLFCFRPS